MTKLKSLVMLLLLTAPPAIAETIEMSVNGLVCGFCAQGIEKSLRRNPATADVLVSLEHRIVVVATKEGMDIPDADLREALTNAGYAIKSIARTGTPIDTLRARLKAAP